MKITGKCGGSGILARLGLVGFTVLMLVSSCQKANPGHVPVYLEHSLPLVVKADSNDGEYGNLFTLKRQQWLHVRCTGEWVPRWTLSARELDNVQLLFKASDQKRLGSGEESARSYVITRSPAKLIAEPVTPTNRLRYAFSEANSIRRYEVLIPWASLGYQPAVGHTINFNCAATDNDRGEKNQIISWQAVRKAETSLTAMAGRLALQRTTMPVPSGTAACPYIQVNPVLDGQAEAFWQQLPYYYLTSSYGSTAPNKSFAGRFRTCWNERNLYFLVEVEDDVDVFDGYYWEARDYGWLEDAAGQIVWQMSQPAHYNGGSPKNRIVDTVLLMPVGTYLARYSTDESHSPQQWDAPPPTGHFYGIALEYAKRHQIRHLQPAQAKKILPLDSINR